MNVTLENTRKHLDDVVNKVREWALESEQACSKFAANLSTNCESSSALIKGLQEEETDFLSQEKTNLRQQEKENKQLQELQARLQETRAKERDLAPQVDDANSLRDKRKVEVEEQVSAIQKSREKNDFQTQQLTRGAKLYKKLGLSFERVSDDWLKLVFNMIDPANEAREFYFVVCVDKNDKYHVQEINPPLENIQALVDALNSSNDFSKFVRQMRSRFKQAY